MTVPRRNHLPALAASIVLSAVVGGCSSGGDEDPTIFTTPRPTCTKDVSSDDAKDIVERVGGLSTKDYTVKFAKGTEIGVVALVDENAPRAFQELHDDYGVVAVARQNKDGDSGSISGFTQVQEIVDSVCD